MTLANYNDKISIIQLTTAFNEEKLIDESPSPIAPSPYFMILIVIG